MLRQLAGSKRGADAKISLVDALYLAYSTAELWVPLCCHRTHICLIDNVLHDAFFIATGCLRPTPTDHLPIQTSSQLIFVNDKRHSPYLTVKLKTLTIYCMANKVGPQMSAKRNRDLVAGSYHLRGNY